MSSSPRAPFSRILEQPHRNELKAICRALRLYDSGRKTVTIVDRILGRRPEGGRDTLTALGVEG